MKIDKIEEDDNMFWPTEDENIPNSYIGEEREEKRLKDKLNKIETRLVYDNEFDNSQKYIVDLQQFNLTVSIFLKTIII